MPIRIILPVMLSATQAVAQAENPVLRAWDQFVTTCTQVMTDPAAFISALPIPGPAGEPVFYQTEDNRRLQIDTIVGGFVVDAQIIAIRNIEVRGCTLSINDHSGDGPDLARDAIDIRVGARMSELENLSITGGRNSRTIPTGPPPAPVHPAEPFDEHWFEGLIPDIDTIGFASFGDGFLSFYLNRVIHRNDRE